MEMTRLKPVNGHVLLRLDEKSEKSTGGIILLDESKKPSTTATVLGVGNGIDDEIKPQERVVVKPYAGKEIEIDDKQYLLIDARYIIATLD